MATEQEFIATGRRKNAVARIRMTAGTGVLHSEYSSPTDKTYLLQIWVLPEKERLTPGYEQKKFPREEKRENLKLIASLSCLRLRTPIVLSFALLVSCGRDPALPDPPSPSRLYSPWP